MHFRAKGTSATGDSGADYRKERAMALQVPELA
jgi:hypothetical protein